MIGTKKLSTIRKEVEWALASEGGDAIQELDRQIATAKRKGEGTAILAGLRRFLETPTKPRKRKGKKAPARSRK